MSEFDPLPKIEHVLSKKRFHQMAMYVNVPEFSVSIMRECGYKNWIYDEADLIGEMNGKAFETHATMYFNYEFYGSEGKQDVMMDPDTWIERPSELEFLNYEGPSWHSAAGRTDINGQVTKEPFISHMSVNVKNSEKEVSRIEREFGLQVIQWFDTKNHLNKYLKQQNVTFHEYVFDSRLVWGFDIKLISKVHH